MYSRLAAAAAADDDDNDDEDVRWWLSALNEKCNDLKCVQNRLRAGFV